MKFVKLTRLKKFLRLTIIIVAIIAIALIYYLIKPLSPPQIAIKFQEFKLEKTKVFHMKLDTNFNGRIFFQGVGNDFWLQSIPNSTNFSTEQTNLWCVAYLTNFGPARIWWISSGCEIEARTPNGWITNEFNDFMTIQPWSVGASKKDIFNIAVPIDAIEWRVTGEFEYYKHDNALHEFMGWLVDDLKLSRQHTPRIVIDSFMPVLWTLSLLPQPKEETVQFQSEFFTNKPPIGFSFTNSITP